MTKSSAICWTTLPKNGLKSLRKRDFYRGAHAFKGNPGLLDFPELKSGIACGAVSNLPGKCGFCAGQPE
jgi:hypothetical protein